MSNNVLIVRYYMLRYEDLKLHIGNMQMIFPKSAVTK